MDEGTTWSTITYSSKQRGEHKDKEGNVNETRPKPIGVGQIIKKSEKSKGRKGNAR